MPSLLQSEKGKGPTDTGQGDQPPQAQSMAKNGGWNRIWKEREA